MLMRHNCSRSSIVGPITYEGNGRYLESKITWINGYPQGLDLRLSLSHRKIKHRLVVKCDMITFNGRIPSLSMNICMPKFNEYRITR